MMDMLDIVFVIGLLLLIPSAVFVLELVMGLKGFRAEPGTSTQRSCALIVPAHNEEAVLADTLRNLTSELGPTDRIVVVADNCSDSTAAIAAQWGCEVLERTDSENRGKGFALAFAVSYLEDNPPDIAIIVDADCEVSSGSIARLKAACVRTGGPVQAQYLMYAQAHCPPQRRVTEFAIYLKNHVRLLGLSRLGGSVPVTGSGFAVPFEMLSGTALATGNIAEDMKLGVELAAAGAKVSYVPDAYIASPLPNAEAVAGKQRLRWEHGHLGIIAQWLPVLLGSAIKKRRWSTWMTALDLSVLPLTLLVFCNLVLFCIATAIAVISGDARLLIVVAAVLVSMFSLLVIADACAQKSRLRLGDITWVFTFAAGKIAIYHALLTGRKSRWEKSSRD